LQVKGGDGDKEFPRILPPQLVEKIPGKGGVNKTGNLRRERKIKQPKGLFKTKR